MALTVPPMFENRWDPARGSGRDRRARLPLEPARLRPRDRQLRRRQHVGQDARARPHRPRDDGAVGQGIGQRSSRRSGRRLRRPAPRRDPPARAARRDERRRDGVLPRALPARPLDAAPLDRDAAACVRAARARRPRIPTPSGPSSAAPTASAWRRSASARTPSGSPTCARIRALEAGRRGRGRASAATARPAREALARDLGRDRRGVVRGHARRDQPRRRLYRRAHPGQAGLRRTGRGALSARPRAPTCWPRCPRRARGVSVDGPRILQTDGSAAVLEFVCGSGVARPLAGRSRRSRTTFVHTRRRPVWIDFDPEQRGDAATLQARIAERVREWREREGVYVERYGSDERLADPSPRVIVVQGVGLISRWADAEGGPARARPLPPGDQRDAHGLRARRSSSRLTTRNPSRSSTGRSSSTSSRSRRRPASSRA